ncbi:hypothetical protein Tco_1179107, partial [Tanacetum coccineum]
MKEKESAEKEVSTEDALSTASTKVILDKEESLVPPNLIKVLTSKNYTDKEEVSTDRPDEGTVDQNKGRSATQTAPTTTTPTIFGDDETIAQIDPKDNGKKKIEEEDEFNTESEAEEEVKKLAEEEAIKAALSNEYDFIQARLNADKILAEKLQEEERERYSIEQRAKFLHDTITAQRRFLAQQRSKAIRNKPPSGNQLRNQMMTYLKHVGGKKLKKKTKPVITHQKAWMKSVSMKQRFSRKKSLKKQWMQKESVSKHGRKPAKAEPTVHKDPTFNE